MAQGDFYRQSIPDLNLSIERATEAVPDDGKYHVLRSGELLGSYRILKRAQEVFRRVVQESGYAPKPSDSGKTASEMLTDRYMEAKDLYWSDSHKHRGGGGRGGRGGV